MPLFSRKSPPDASATPVRRKPSLDFSLTGLVYCSMMMFMGLAAINSQAALLFGVFGLMIGVLLVSGVISRKVIRRLKVRRVLPDHGSVGRPMTMTYRFTNDKRFWPSLSVTVAELDGAEGFTKQPQTYLLHAAPRMTASVPTEMIPKRRGLHQLDRYQISTSFPFGFIKRAIIDHHVDRLLVYPPLAQVDRQVLMMCRAAENTGATMRPRKGGQDEFYGVKEYRPGDNPRRIYWRRSARTSAYGVLVAKEMTQVAPPRLLILVDTCLRDRSVEEHVRVERAVAMAASLAAKAVDEDLSVGLFVWSDGWKGIDPSRGKRHRNDLLSVLARLPLNTEHTTADLLRAGRHFLREGTTPILLTPRDGHGAPAEEASNGLGSLVVIPSTAPAADHWFRFDPGVDFATAMPTEQQPRMEKRSRQKRSQKPQAAEKRSQKPQATSQ
jgi:uncharacterized protein (DUF58 family)